MGQICIWLIDTAVLNIKTSNRIAQLLTFSFYITIFRWIFIGERSCKNIWGPIWHDNDKGWRKSDMLWLPKITRENEYFILLKWALLQRKIERNPCGLLFPQRWSLHYLEVQILAEVTSSLDKSISCTDMKCGFQEAMCHLHGRSYSETEKRQE